MILFHATSVICWLECRKIAFGKSPGALEESLTSGFPIKYFGYVLAFWISFVPPFHTIFRTLLFLYLEARQGMTPWQQTSAELLE